ncbi:hypothetical protein HS125_16580 [bacterium]|nr:hypothetical protein [bacterium]
MVPAGHVQQSRLQHTVGDPALGGQRHRGRRLGATQAWTDYQGNSWQFVPDQTVNTLAT